MRLVMLVAMVMACGPVEEAGVRYIDAEGRPIADIQQYLTVLAVEAGAVPGAEIALAEPLERALVAPAASLVQQDAAVQVQAELVQLAPATRAVIEHALAVYADMPPVVGPHTVLVCVETGSIDGRFAGAIQVADTSASCAAWLMDMPAYSTVEAVVQEEQR